MSPCSPIPHQGALVSSYKLPSGILLTHLNCSSLRNETPSTLIPNPSATSCSISSFIQQNESTSRQSRRIRSDDLLKVRAEVPHTQKEGELQPHPNIKKSCSLNARRCVSLSEHSRYTQSSRSPRGRLAGRGIGPSARCKVVCLVVRVVDLGSMVQMLPEGHCAGVGILLDYLGSRAPG
ncbi:hypothetical protein Aspvir_004913 [Aspergillus viridinutans]|uniref:Uncharacterized protein n=1 Tax=Aspergillus viridinutans TaxID=75553 RepID=A0A9P3F0Z4_ASPVI|nr:uncharacterized protein Aspvir_004913 [Aspergillus viridinutans]GIK00884.1 hypothetical protein Aspvir_004913 [Aspergillus viridinutans]